MKVLVQRVKSASVAIDSEVVARISKGLLLFVGFGAMDEDVMSAPLAIKVANLRVFPDERGRFQFSLLETGGAVLAVPNFTLYADTVRGRRPDFTGAMTPGVASGLFDGFVAALRDTGIEQVQCGRFGAGMQVSLENDGPVTLMLED